jgi:hypothetical protein
VVSVTATSSELWWAEVVAKAAVIVGCQAAPSMLRRHGCAGLVLDLQGVVHTVDCAIESREGVS